MKTYFWRTDTMDVNELQELLQLTAEKQTLNSSEEAKSKIMEYINEKLGFSCSIINNNINLLELELTKKHPRTDTIQKLIIVKFVWRKFSDGGWCIKTTLGI
jgi:DNA polymerase III delta subunit